ncbi:MAG: tRNA pseudouridine(38-40) synthase TruA [Acidobacteriota bacterium]
MKPLPIPHRQKYRAIIQYAGTRYAGWQIQKNALTVQGVLRETLSRLAGYPVTVVGSGRTDSGVHALGQVAHFFFPEKESIPDLRRALNALLPWDIRVIRLAPAAPGFHAQKQALKKRYEYRILTAAVLPPFLHARVHHLPLRLDFDALQEGAALLRGRHDFSSFTAAASRVRSHTRTVLLSDFRRKGHRLVYRIEADGFLHHMVRNIVGTLIEVGLGKRRPQDLPALLEARDRTLAGPTAPADGLYLVRVWYRPSS